MTRANLDHFARAMPRIEAQEALGRYHAAVLASGNVKREAVRSALRTLERQAYGGRRRDAYRPGSTAERHNLLTALGVHVNGG